MSLTKQKRDELKQFVLWNVEDYPKGLVTLAKYRYRLSRTTILKYISELGREGLIGIEGATRDRIYSPRPLVSYKHIYQKQDRLAEDRVWRVDIAPLFHWISENVRDICLYGFIEMMNNAIDHSGASQISVEVTVWIDRITMCIADDGVGIFNKLQKAFDLDDPFHVILELSKGKLTTDPEGHSGEGIFFSSRMFDSFAVFSGKHCFGCKKVGVSYETDRRVPGTEVHLEISPYSERTKEDIFSRFTNNADHFTFDRTVVPVNLARYGTEDLVSRPQAKRLMNRLDGFKTATLDFENIEGISRAFADEIFRVYARNHPALTILTVNENKAVRELVQAIRNSNGSNHSL